jgi:hypothetical protein
MLVYDKRKFYLSSGAVGRETVTLSLIDVGSAAGCQGQNTVCNSRIHSQVGVLLRRRGRTASSTLASRKRRNKSSIPVLVVDSRSPAQEYCPHNDFYPYRDLLRSRSGIRTER